MFLNDFLCLRQFYRSTIFLRSGSVQIIGWLKETLQLTAQKIARLFKAKENV